jgi:DNA-binding PadR family transcriptional regulator
MRRARPTGEVTALVLAALADRDRHGYAILEEVRAMSGGRVSLGTGTLYGALERLTEQGWIEVSSEQVVEGRLRRSYRITGNGRAVLADEISRQEQWVSAARARLAGAG